MAGEFFGELGGEDFGGGAAGLGAGGGDVVAFGGGDGLQGFDGDAGLFREGDGGGAGDAVLVGDLDGGAEELFGEVGLALGDVVDEDGEAARGGEAWAGAPAGMRRSRSSRARVRLRSSACAPASMRAGTSSRPISKRKSMWSYRNGFDGAGRRRRSPERSVAQSTTGI